MSKKFIDEDGEEMAFYIYPPVSMEEGNIQLEGSLADLCMEVEELETKGNLSEYNQGMYNAIIELMAAPAAILDATMKKLLSVIIEEEEDRRADLEDDEASECAVNSAVARSSEALKKSEEKGKEVKGEVLPKQIDDDISDDELMSELQAKERHSYNDLDDYYKQHGYY